MLISFVVALSMIWDTWVTAITNCKNWDVNFLSFHLLGDKFAEWAILKKCDIYCNKHYGCINYAASHKGLQ